MDINKIWELLKGLIQSAETSIPGNTGKDKKDWVINEVLQLVNAGEIMLGIAKFMMLPPIEAFQKYIIGLGVERAWTELKLPQDAVAKLNAPTPEAPYEKLPDKS
jgi:hypothetical protein